jgi:hypothetical protein
MRRYLVALMVAGSLAFVACGNGASAPAGTVTAHATASAPAPSRTPIPTGTRTAIVTTATPAGFTTPPAWPASTPAPSGDSGVEGTVTIGPTCPVQRIDSPCPDRPYEATVIVLDAARRPVAEVRSAADGHFRVVLAPGAYTLSPQAQGAFPHAAEQTVTVLEGQITTVQIAFDSGIR